jgi:hypothetical protein
VELILCNTLFFLDNLETIQDEQTMHDDDEESRIFSGQGNLQQ